MSGAVEVLTEDLTELRVKVNEELSGLLTARAKHSQWVLVWESVLVLAFIMLAFMIQRRVTNYIAGKLTSANAISRDCRRASSTTRSANSPPTNSGIC